MANRVKLKPCPFCGGKATLKRAFRYMYAVWCTKCEIGTLWRTKAGRNYARWNKQWAVDNWNRRVNENEKEANNAKQDNTANRG